jgi:hypothetical protein
VRIAIRRRRKRRERRRVMLTHAGRDENGRARVAATHLVTEVARSIASGGYGIDQRCAHR